MPKDADYYQHISQLVSTALNDPDIAADQHLVALLRKVDAAAADNQKFYDDRRKFQPTVSLYALEHHNKVPAELLDLLKYVDTPNSWSGF